MRWIFVLFSTLTLAADRTTDPTFRTWFTLESEHQIGTSRFSIRNSLQFRPSDTTSFARQFLIQPLLNYQLTRSTSAGIGYAHLWTSSVQSPSQSRPYQTESRVWQQFLHSYGNERHAWTTRLRTDQRFFRITNPNAPTTTRYENRVRLQQRYLRPLTPNSYLTLADEIFFLVPPYQSAQAFDQNRIIAAYGRRLGNHNGFEIGYMNRRLARRDGRVLESAHILTLTFTHRSGLFSKPAPLRR